MPYFTFEMVASVTAEGETEADAREALRKSAIYQEEDVEYHGVGVYLSSTSANDAKLVETYTP